MATSLGVQRIRDPLHDLIVFNTREQFDEVIWNVIQTPQFQRLRRIKQLGFSDFVYPGATHTRFTHSIGVFHTARRLMGVIERYIRSKGEQVKDHQLQVALAAALVHDVGHGMFSHAFEDIGKHLGLKMARHENVSSALIKETEIQKAFEPLGRGFAEEVADVIAGKKPANLYDAVVSSQFDADRLDYMRRDRLMAGVQNSGIDFDWLVANLEVGKVKTGVDDEELPGTETFVLGPKALYAAETYILALFQLYPTVYFHKATRAAEKVFTTLMTRAIQLAADGDVPRTGLPENHPIVRFARDSENLELVQNLDDTVFWGALALFEEAPDKAISEAAKRLKVRRLPKCIDLYDRVNVSVRPDKATLDKRTVAEAREAEEASERSRKLVTAALQRELEEWSKANSDDGFPRILVDVGERSPYKPFEQASGPLKQILIRTPDNGICDMAELSQVIAGTETFRLFRAYVCDGDREAKAFVEKAAVGAITGAKASGGGENV